MEGGAIEMTSPDKLETNVDLNDDLESKQKIVFDTSSLKKKKKSTYENKMLTDNFEKIRINTF